MCKAHDSLWALAHRILAPRTPQAFPHLNQTACSALSSYYANLLNDHFVPYLPPLPILPPYK